jgi:O-antigen ligase
MKTKHTRAATAPRFHLVELLFLALPLIALTPNFFIIPTLSYPGLATQEFVFALAVFAFAGACLFRAWQLPATPQFQRSHLLTIAALAAFLGWQLVSLAWAPDWSEGIRVAALWFGLLIFLITGWWALRESARWTILAGLLVTTTLLLWSLFYEYTHYGPNEMLGIFFNHGLTAELLALLWPCCVVIFLCEKRQRVAVVAALLAAACSTAALLLTLRRAPLLGVLVSGLCIGVALLTGILKVADKQRLVLVAGALLLIVLPLTIYKREALLARLRGATQLQTAVNTRAVELGLTSRAVTWLTAWEMGKHNPLRGVGHGGYEAKYGQYKRFFAENPRYASVAAVAETEDYDEIHSPRAHSEYLQMFAELGLIGVLLFAAFWIQVARQLWLRRHGANGFLALGALLSLLTFAVCSLLSAFSFRMSPGVLVLSCVLALGLTVPLKAEDGQRDKPVLLPKPLVLGAAVLALFASLLILGRSYNVYASQQTQSQLDFLFNLNNPATNEALTRRYQQVLDLDPANAGAHLGYSVLLFQMKRLPESLQHADYAFAHGYSRPYTYVLRAFCHEQLGDLTKATQILQECLASFPKSIVARAVTAELLRKQGQTEEAQQQRVRLESVDARIARSWDLALRMKDAAAAEQAKSTGLLAPGELEPLLMRVLIQARAYHYLK